MKNVKIRFLKWDDFNKRSKEYKRPSWFSLDNDFPVNKNFFEFTAEERLCTICLLCEASKQNDGGQVNIHVEHFCHIANLSPKALLSAIVKLKENQILESDDPNTIVTKPSSDPVQAGSRPLQTDMGTNILSSDADPIVAVNNSKKEELPKPEQVFDLWNAKCKSLPKAKTLSAVRKTLIQKRLHECNDPEVWAAAIELLANSSHHSGQNDRNWKADIDFFLQEKQFPKWIDKATQALEIRGDRA